MFNAPAQQHSAMRWVRFVRKGLIGVRVIGLGEVAARLTLV
jgi:hypothetical protein